ncbi:CLAVATA3/ESR (CLE)-related protein 46-like [Olea europaea var. sylvestris]|uniref:CLAVATA3/ESR (CLE)-related protein 46-like n=1 Tax=Olea europaea var. sylvestris TaxID=158386 RepID=UPI000C1D7640|nr:CLAVATA3/ESR (CLE)-related protein 46-like [Olea europaea var. sylvestris]
MIRTRILLYLLLVWLISAAFQQHQAIGFNVRATESVDFKIKPAEYRTAAGHIMRTLAGNVKGEKEKKIRKAPSGPNPIGNRRPPSKP